MTEHDLVLMIQRQRAALIAERDALREQVAALAAERDVIHLERLALQEENQELREMLSKK